METKMQREEWVQKGEGEGGDDDDNDDDGVEGEIHDVTGNPAVCQTFASR